MARGLALAAAIAVSLLAVSGAGGTATQQAPKRGGTVAVGVTVQAACFNLLVADCGIQPAFVRQVLEGAYEVGPDLSYRPNLVTHVDAVSKKPFTLVYYIRPEARWSDGVPVTARDFVFTWRTYSKLELTDFPPAIRSVRALDAKTVKVDFRVRFAGWRDLFGVVLPRHALAGEDPRTIWRDGIDNPKTGDPIGSGPFLVGALERGRQFTLVRNRRYWGPHQSYLDRLVFRYVTPPVVGSQLAALRDGTVDLIFGISAGVEQTAICREPGVTCLVGLGLLGWEHIAIRQGPGGHNALEQRSVRQAIAYGIDRDDILRRLYPHLPSLQPQQNFFFFRGQRLYEPHWNAYSYRPAESRRLLEQAGCDRGADGIFMCTGKRMSLRLVTTAGVPSRQRTVELIQKQLWQAGIEIVPEFASRATFLEDILPNGKFDLAEFGFPMTPDPGSGADIWRCSGSRNYTGYCSRLVTQELAQARLIVDLEQRARAVNRADRQMAKAVPAFPLGRDPQIVAFKGIRLRGLVYNPTDERVLWNSEDWWLER